MINAESINLFLMDGKVGGLLTAEIRNWTGHIISGPRKDLGRIKALEEVNRTGVYILFGTNDDGEDAAYRSRPLAWCICSCR